jgi:hypothetical protein
MLACSQPYIPMMLPYLYPYLSTTHAYTHMVDRPAHTACVRLFPLIVSTCDKIACVLHPYCYAYPPEAYMVWMQHCLIPIHTDCCVSICTYLDTHILLQTREALSSSHSVWSYTRTM